MTTAVITPRPGALAERLGAVRPASVAELSVEHAAERLWRDITTAETREDERRALQAASRAMNTAYLDWVMCSPQSPATVAASKAAWTLYWLAAFRLWVDHGTGALPDDTTPF